MVVTIRDSLEVSAPLDRVWDIIADVDNDPKYWPNIHTVDNISKDGNVMEREVTVGFRKSESSDSLAESQKIGRNNNDRRTGERYQGCHSKPYRW
ncbi:MAG: hypothetical protein DLM72_19715 [Candidatus Nitrosopolaris wilkensis]|nr:MAG: hypothetical protein DLM72_19715 [Candidatus Nitrosopolaris wilkensis]